jgi:hypothetical protein
MVGKSDPDVLSRNYLSIPQDSKFAEEPTHSILHTAVKIGAHILDFHSISSETYCVFAS